MKWEWEADYSAPGEVELGGSEGGGKARYDTVPGSTVQYSTVRYGHLDGGRASVGPPVT